MVRSGSTELGTTASIAAARPVDLEFRLLGPVEIRDRGGSLDLGPPKQRALLAVLLCMPDAVVSPDLVVDELWGANPPPSAAANIRGYVAGLRRALPPAERHRLARRAHGYQLTAGPDEVDAGAFEAIATQGRAALQRRDPAAAARLLERALGLWRGLPLEDVPRGSRLDGVVARLDEGRMAVQEDLFEARLSLGEDGRLVPALRQWLDRYPLREKAWRHLVLALYRAGDPSAALATYQQARAVLVAELGIEPGPDLRELQRAILHRDDGALAPAAPVVRYRGPAPVPRELPPVPFGFVGRARELALIRDIVHASGPDGLPRAVALYGPAGIGKSALARVAAHALAADHPDGQLFVELRGADDPLPVLNRMLRALGAGDPPPQDVAEASGRFRSVVADKRILLLLDNAAGEEIVEPLLPAGGGCAVVVTSRSALPGLDAGRRLALRPLPEDDARELLSRYAGADRVAAGSAAVQDILRRCAGLPLALRQAAGGLAASGPARTRPSMRE